MVGAVSINKSYERRLLVSYIEWQGSGAGIG